MKQINKIKGYENVKEQYYITTCGKFLTKKRKKIINNQYLNYKGYLVSHLMDNEGNKKSILTHRIVAGAFVENKKNKPQVNHKDEIKTNNFYKILEWVTPKENSNYGTRNDKISKNKIGNRHFRYRDKESYLKKSTTKNTFKLACKDKKWDFNNFEEIFSGKYKTFSNGKKQKLYYYKEVKNEK